MARRNFATLHYVAGRLLGAWLTLVVLSSCVFFVLRIVPGDTATLILGEEASPRALQELRSRLMLDQPLGIQYAHYLTGFVSGDWGMSLLYPTRTVSELVAQAMLPTAELALLAVGLGATAGIIAAELSVGPFLAHARGWVHAGILVVAAVPLLAFAPLVTWFVAVKWQWMKLPGDPEAGVFGLLFAAALLSLPLGAQVARVARASLLDQTRARYLVVARAKGAGPFRIWFIHALAVSAPPIAVVVAMQLGALLGGAVVLERLFDRPGLGTLMLKAYFARDLPVLQACVTAAGSLFVAAQTLSAAVQASVDPRRGEVVRAP